MKFASIRTYRNTHFGSNGDITQKLEMLHSKLQNLSEKDKIVKSTYSIKQI